MDIRDWAILVLMALAGLVSDVFLFVTLHQAGTAQLGAAVAAFATWGTFHAALLSAYHWMVIRDSKEKDA